HSGRSHRLGRLGAFGVENARGNAVLAPAPLGHVQHQPLELFTPRAPMVRAAAMKASLSDTIMACATAQGEAALAAIRLSGPQALSIGRTLAGRTSGKSHKLCRV